MTSTGSTLSARAAQAAELVSQYPRREVLPDFLERKLNIERWEAVPLLQELAEAGYGKFILGRRGGKTRLEKADHLPQAARSTYPTEVPFQSDLWQVFLLRRDPPIQVKVPADITIDEAEKLGKWLLLIANDSH